MHHDTTIFTIFRPSQRQFLVPVSHLTLTNSQIERKRQKGKWNYHCGWSIHEKFARHNLFMCVAWSEANVPSKTLSTNYRDANNRNSERQTVSLSLSISFYLFLPAYSVCRSCSCTCNGVAFSHSNELMHEIYNKQMGYGCQTREIWCQMKMLRSISQRDTKIHQLILRIFHVLQLQLSTSNTLFMFFKSINNRCAIP